MAVRRRRFFCEIAASVLVVVGGGGITAHAQPNVSAPPAAEPRPEASLEELKKRVLAYWEARARKDYRAEWELLEPRARARISADEYGRGRMVQYLAAQVEGAERRGNFARVAVRLLVRVTHPLLPGGARTESTTLGDHWVLIGGTWFRSLEADAGTEPPWPAPSSFFLDSPFGPTV